MPAPHLSPPTNLTEIAEVQRCQLVRTSVSASYPVLLVHFLFILVSSKLLHSAVRRFYQPRVVADLAVAILIGKVTFLQESFSPYIGMVLDNLGHYCFAAYMFALGLEMDPLAVFESPKSDTIISYASMLSTVILGALSSSALLEPDRPKGTARGGGVEKNEGPVYLRSQLGLVAALANTASPVLTRLATELKISGTRVGRLAIGAGIHTDMVSTFLMSTGSMLVNTYHKMKTLSFLLGLISEMVLTIIVAKPIMGWINGRNPEGKQMKGVDVVGVAAMVVVLCGIATALHGDANMAAFLIGLALPRQGRASRLLVNNINLLLSSVILPLYVCFVCLSLRNDKNGAQSSRSDYIIDTTDVPWAKLLMLSATGAAGKVLGTLVAGRAEGLGWLESLALGLLLNMKGYYHIFCAYQATLFVAILSTVVGTAMLTPLVGVTIATLSRRGARRRQLMGLQFLDPTTSDARVMMGLYAAENIPTVINLIEALRGGAGTRDLTVYAVDMVEMTDRAAATLVKGDGHDAVTVGDESVVEFRKQIDEALVAYQQDNGDGVKIRRLLALSSFSGMHQDVCSYAEDVLAVLIVLPFHRRLRLDGSMDSGHPGHRQVNQKVLQYAPCSVGILVDRGLGQASKSSLSEAAQNVVAVFIGGSDDREALTLAARMSQHPGVQLTVIRFLPDAKARARASVRTALVGHGILASASREELQMRADDEYFAEFYERYVANKGVSYVERNVADGGEVVTILRSLESQYQLFVVGRGRGRSSAITDGLAEWAECPEIGPIGDILASSEFSVTASVLIIQQHDFQKRLKVVDEEFMPF